MRPALAIARLTFREGMRMRIVLVFLIVLAFVTLRLPFALKGDETLSGRLQTFLSYSLSALSLFLGLATVFFSCATLAFEFRNKSLQMVVTKPVSRFQVLLGKWIGVNALNLLIVLLAGSAIYGFGVFIKNRPESFERDRLKLRDTVWTARAAGVPTIPAAEIDEEARAAVEALKKQGATFSQGEAAAVEQKRRELLELWKTVPPGEGRTYVFENLAAPETDETIFQIRFKVRGAPLTEDELVPITWLVYDARTGELRDMMDTQQRSGETHQFFLRAKVVQDSRAFIGVVAAPPPNPTVVYFEGEKSLELLYKVGSFEANYCRTLLLILARLAFLSAVGVFFSTFTSFPVACFCTLSIQLFCMAVPWWLESVGANMEVGQGTAKLDPYGALGPAIRTLLVPVLTYALPDFFTYDGVASLIDGIYISGSLMTRALTHTLVYGVVLLLLPGWLIFSRREVAQAQS